MLTLQFDPFPILSTPRFQLRRHTPADVPFLFAMRSDPAVMRFVPRPLCQDLDAAEQVFRMMEDKIDQNTGINWVISRCDEPETYLGVIGIFRVDTDNHRGEIGYMLLPAYWNQGVVSELIPEVLRYGFDTMGLHSMEAVIDPENHASRRVLEKHGFVQEAYFREDCYFDGKFLDSVVLSLLKSAVPPVPG